MLAGRQVGRSHGRSSLSRPVLCFCFITETGRGFPFSEPHAFLPLLLWALPARSAASASCCSSEGLMEAESRNMLGMSLPK
ncbi:hypothetical protein FKM82_029255 [Ascaphus truei]